MKAIMGRSKKPNISRKKCCFFGSFHTWERYLLFRLTGNLVIEEDTELKETLFDDTKKSNEIKEAKSSWDFSCKCIISKLLLYRQSKPIRRLKPFEIVSSYIPWIFVDELDYFFQFKFADRLDILFMVIGTIASIGTG